MKNYQARPFFRTLAGLVAIIGWITSILSVLMGWGEYNHTGDAKEIWVGIGGTIFSLAMTFIAIKGELPKVLAIFIRFPLWDYNGKKKL